MSARDGYEPGVPCWIDIWQRDAEAAVRFYSEVFGWAADDTMPPGTPGSHYMCRLPRPRRRRDRLAARRRPAGAAVM